MNIRKPTDYVTMFTTLDTLMAAQLPQMELYREIGRVVSGRAEKGAAVAASEYLQAAYPTAEGFSPRNLRRMRAFYAAYEESPEIIRLAMHLGWTQNVAILETVQQQRGTGVVHPSRAAFWMEESKIAGIAIKISGMADILLSTSRRFPAILVKMK